MANLTNGQTCLEKYSIEERHNEISRSDYNADDQYGATHKDALSDGDIQGKGTGHGGHSYWLPYCTNLANSGHINYSNFDTANGGNCVDVAMRNRHFTRSLYNTDNYYWTTTVNTQLNREDGQYVVGYNRTKGICQIS